MTQITSTTTAQPRWQVVDRDSCNVGLPFYRRSYAVEEADRLNTEGVEAFRPYTVTDMEVLEARDGGVREP